MAITSKLNTAIMLYGGSGSKKKNNATYGSYISGGMPSPTPTTINPYQISYSGVVGGVAKPAVPALPKSAVKMPNTNLNSNVVQVGMAQNNGNSVGVTDEGVVVGGGATPLPQIKSGSSSGSGSSGSSGASTYGSWLQNIVSKVTGAVGSAANNQKMTLPAQAGQSAQRVNLSTGTNSASGATGTGAATEQKAYAGAWAGSEPIDSYEEFLRNKESAYGSMRDEQTQFYDAQSQKALEAIEAQRQAAIAEANNQKTMVDTAATEQKNAALAEAQAQKDLLTTMSQEQRDAVYKFAEEQRISDMNYAAKQYQLLLNSINAQRESGMTMATEQRDLLLSMSEEQRQAAYKHAEEQRASATAYANSQYQTLVDAINAQKESGMAMAEEQRQLLLSMSEEQRNAIYAAAESQRVAAEQRADVERERGVVDARSSYEQNKASYGANAEAMGSMGLSGSGYSDYLNSKAYAQQRAETQAANAQADASKREARYTEDQARLKADSDYYQNKYNAEQAYSDRKYQIDTTYQTNMLNAEQNKAQSIYEAESAERDAKYSADSAHAQNEYSAEAQYSQNKYEVDTTYQNNLLGANQSKAQAEHEATSAERESKFNADQAHAQNQYAAESGYSQSKYEAESAERDAKLQAGLSYSENLFNAESQARSDKLAAEQTADAGKFSAEMSYQENLLNNDDAIGAYRQEQAEKAEAEAKQAAAKAEEEAQYARAAYTELLSGANSGAYTAAQLEQLAADYGLSDAQKQSLINAANEYTTKKQAAANAEISANTGDIAGSVQSAIDNGSISKEQGQEHIYNSYKDEIAYGGADTGTIDAAYSKGQITEAQYNDLKARWNNNIETSADFFYSNGTMLNKSAAKQALDNLTKQPWLSQANKNAITAIYNSLYSPVTKNVKFNNDGGWWIFGSTDTGADGNNFSVITSDGTKYRVEYGGEATDTNIKEVGSSVSDGQMFGYQEKLYIKQNGKIYNVTERDNSYGDHYDALYNIFFGSGDPTSVQSANNAGSSAKTSGGSSGSSSTSSTPVTYPSDSEIASKASSGTLTYHDVAKYNAGIRTASEFARGNNSDKQTYGTYQAYLKAMYDKYAPSSSSKSSSSSSSSSSSGSTSSSSSSTTKDSSTIRENKSSSSSSSSPSSGKWKSYSDASKAGYSNIMTKSEWARRKASTGCSTYQEYLDKMYAKYMK